MPIDLKGCNHTILSMALACLLSTGVVFGQDAATGAISGRISDPADAAIAGATVDVTNTGTGAKYTAATTADGFYVVRFLQPGIYTAEAVSAGFQKAIQPNIEVIASGNPTVNFKLVIGSVNQTVTVRDKVGLVELQDADRSGEIDKARVLDTPTLSQMAMYVLMTVPGVAWSRNDNGVTPSSNSNSSGWKINGSQDRGGEMLVDGVSNRTLRNGMNYGLMPTQSSVSEVQVITNPYRAEYGSTTGGVIIMNTRSGSNEFHGEAFSNVRNTVFDANQFERNRAGQPRPVLKYNIYGGIVTGRAIRDKLFFTFSYQTHRSMATGSYLGYVPTKLERNGDFSQTYYSNNGVAAPISLYDPWTTVLNSTTNRYSRQAFPGAQIPASRINPVAAALWQYIPLPNIATNSLLPASNYMPQGNSNTPRRYMEWFPRIDWNINDNSKLMARFTRTNYNEFSLPFYPTAADFNASAPFFRANLNGVVDYTRTLSPTSVFDVRISSERYNTGTIPYAWGAAGPKELGFSQTYIAETPHVFPAFNFGGSQYGGTNFSGAGNSGMNVSPDQVSHIDASYSKITGRHTIKIGGQYRVERVFEISPGNQAGSFKFVLDDTNGPDPQVSTGAAGNPTASFLLGVGSGSVSINDNPSYQVQSQALSVQDDIKITPRFTLNLGLRWDHTNPITERFNALTGVFNTTMASPIASKVQANLQQYGITNCPACNNLAGGLTFPGVNGASRGIYDSTYTNFGPRIAGAYAIGSKTAVRAGWGLFYGPIYYYVPSTAGFSQSTQWIAYDQNNVPINSQLLDNAFPNGLTQPTGSKLGAATNLGTGVSFVDPKTREPRSRQLSVEIQRELPWNIRVSAAYVNNIVDRLPVTKSLNTISADQFTTLQSQLNQLVPNPFYGVSEMKNYALGQNQKIAYSQLLYAFPQYTGVSMIDSPIGSSRYDSAQFYAVKRMSNGLSMSVSWTISKDLERTSYQYAADNFLLKKLAAYDMPQIFAPNFVWELPFGHGRHFGAAMPGWADKVAGGWQVNGIIRIQKGIPVQLNSDAISNGTNAVPAHQTLDNWINKSAFTVNTNPWAIARWPNEISNLRCPPIHNLDFSITKKTKLTERVTWELTGIAMNASNTPAFWDSPTGSGVDAASATFGQIGAVRGTSNFPRQFQLGTRLVF